MPYVTEEIWQRLPGGATETVPSVGLAEFPEGDSASHRRLRVSRDDWIIDLITKVRNVRSEMNLGSKPDPALRRHVGRCVYALIRANETDIARLADSQLHAVEMIPRTSASPPRDVPFGARSSPVPLGGLSTSTRSDSGSSARSRRRRKRASRCARARNADFVARAAAEVVDQTRTRVAELDARVERLQELVAAMR